VLARWRGCIRGGRKCLGMGLEIVGRVSNDMDVMSRAMKVLCAVALEYRRLLFVVVFRRRFSFAFVLRV
jgi:hypothetical protein